MKTKAEILESHFYTPDADDMGEIYEAMDEHAQRIAQEFAEWCAKNAYSSYESNQINWTIPEGKWCIADQSNVIPEFSTTSDLFAKFMAERNK